MFDSIRGDIKPKSDYDILFETMQRKVVGDYTDNGLLSNNKEGDPNALDDDVARENSNKKWEPKEWAAEYEIIVMMHLKGYKGVEIARTTGYTPQHIYNILGTPQAIAIETALIEKTREKTINIPDAIARISELTMKRLQDSLADDDMFKKMPGTLITHGLSVMKGTGEHLKNAPTVQTNNTFTLPASVADKFLAGLEKSDQARALLHSKIEDAVVIEEGEDAA